MSFPGGRFSSPSDRAIDNRMSRLDVRINFGSDVKRLVDRMELAKKKVDTLNGSDEY